MHGKMLLTQGLSLYIGSLLLHMKQSALQLNKIVSLNMFLQISFNQILKWV